MTDNGDGTYTLTPDADFNGDVLPSTHSYNTLNKGFN
ncbi:cadherin-like domain-containing protein [Vibrio chagasii]|nr:cadherin-like domain-containing protein [Vibrio chagasii]